MLRVLSVLVALFLFISQSAVPPYALRDPARLQLSAVFLSDIHTETNSGARFQKIGETFQGVFSGGNAPDVIAFAGDNTMNGQNLEWFDFYGLLGRFNHGSDVLVAMGNHDFGNTADHETYQKLAARAIRSYNYYCGRQIERVYYAQDYGAIKFLLLGSEDNAENTVEVLTDAQITWLRAELADCAQRGEPAVVISHNLIRGRTGPQSYYDFNITSQNDALDDALQSSGATVLYICGHSHFGLSEDSYSTEGNVTYVNLPSAGNDGNYHAEGDCAAHGIGLLLEIYPETMALSFRNFAAGVALAEFSMEIPLDR